MQSNHHQEATNTANNPSIVEIVSNPTLELQSPQKYKNIKQETHPLCKLCLRVSPQLPISLQAKTLPIRKKLNNCRRVPLRGCLATDSSSNYIQLING